MNRILARTLLALSCSAALVIAQPAQPKPKSQKEGEALMAIQNAATPDARLAAIDNLLTKFADTEYKPMVLQMAAATAQQKGDSEKMIIYAERTLEADPKNYPAMLMLAQAWATRTREFDLDKEEKLARAEKYANDALEVLKTAPKFRPDLTDEQWTALKKDFTAQAHEALGAVAVVRKKYDVAIAEYKTSMDVASTPDAATMVRLAAALDKAGKQDEAIAMLDKVIAMPDAHPQVKSVATSEKARIQKSKAAGPAAAPANGGVPQVEIKK